MEELPQQLYPGLAQLTIKSSSEGKGVVHPLFALIFLLSSLRGSAKNLFMGGYVYRLGVYNETVSSS